MELFVPVGLLLLFLTGIAWFVISKKKTQSGNGDFTLAPVSVAPPIKDSSAVARIVYGSLDRPALEISPFSLDSTTLLEPLDLSSDKLSHLSGIFTHVPSIVSNATTSGADLYKLTFSPLTTEALANGSVALCDSIKGGFRAIAVDNTNKILEHGTINPVDGLQAATTAVAVWQVASLIVAQKHLADISEKLGQIVDALEELKQRLDNERFGKLRGSLVYMQGISVVIGGGNLHVDEIPQYRHKLEDIEHECLQILSAIEMDIDTREIRLQQFKCKDTVGTKETYEALRNEINDYETELKTWLLAVYVRGAACQLTAALPGGETIAFLRHDAIRTSIEKINFHTKIIEGVEAAVAGTLKSKFNKDKTLNERKQKLCDLVEGVSQLKLERKKSIVLTLDNAVRGINANRNEREQGMQLVGELDGTGKLVRLSRVVNQ